MPYEILVIPNESSVWVELIKALPRVVTAITAIIGVWIAKANLEKWRVETIGKRKAELAEAVLADFYEAREVIYYARMPVTFGHEGASRPRITGETKDDIRCLQAYFAVSERLAKKSEFFAQIEARRFRFIALFGVEGAAPYKELGEIHQTIHAAVHSLLERYKQRDVDSNFEKMERLEEIIWWSPDAKRLNMMVSAIEKICKPSIQELAK